MNAIYGVSTEPPFLNARGKELYYGPHYRTGHWHHGF